jgi:hypothetical protein
MRFIAALAALPLAAAQVPGFPSCAVREPFRIVIAANCTVTTELNMLLE